MIFKTIGRRILFHFGALMIAMVVGLFFQKNYPHLDPDNSSVGTLCYFSLLVIFPPQLGDKRILITSWISGAVFCFFAPWPAAFVVVALQRVIAEIIFKKTFKKVGNVIHLILCFFALAICSSSSIPHPGPIFSCFYVLSNLVSIGFALNWFEQFTKKEDTINNIKEKKKTPTKEPSNIHDEQEVKNQQHHPLPSIVLYERIITNLKLKQNRLPEELSTPIVHICHQAELILTCMRADPRDVEPGDKFLQRYLVAVEKVVDQCIYLLSFEQHSERTKEVKKKSEAFLWRLVRAFTEKQKRLLENNNQDLDVEMKVLDKLLKMEGYD